MSNRHLVELDNAIELWGDFKKRYRLKIRQKRKSRIMKIAGWFFQRLGYMSQAHFLDNVVTVVGRTVYIYEDFLTVGDFGAVLHAMTTAPHEVTHVRQKIKAWNYLLSKTKLAKYEVPAYCADIELRHYLTGDLLHPESLAGRLESYGIKRGSKEWKYAVETFEAVVRMSEKGMYQNKAVKEAIAFLEKR